MFVSDRFIKVPIKIDLIRFIPKGRKIIIVDSSKYKDNVESHLYITNKDFIVKKAIYFPFKIELLGTVLNSNFIYFYHEDTIVLINIRSKLYSKTINSFNITDMDKLITINLKDITLDNDNRINKISFNNMRVDKKNEKIIVEMGIITDKYIMISDLMIEINSSLSDKEFINMNTLRKFEKLVFTKDIQKNYLILPNDDKQKVLSFNKESNLIKIFDSLDQNKLLFTLLIEDDEIIFCNDFYRDGRLYLLVLTPIIVRTLTQI